MSYPFCWAFGALLGTAFDISSGLMILGLVLLSFVAAVSGKMVGGGREYFSLGWYFIGYALGAYPLWLLVGEWGPPVGVAGCLGSIVGAVSSFRLKQNASTLQNNLAKFMVITPGLWLLVFRTELNPGFLFLNFAICGALLTLSVYYPNGDFAPNWGLADTLWALMVLTAIGLIGQAGNPRLGLGLATLLVAYSGLLYSSGTRSSEVHTLKRLAPWCILFLTMLALFGGLFPSYFLG